MVQFYTLQKWLHVEQYGRCIAPLLTKYVGQEARLIAGWQDRDAACRGKISVRGMEGCGFPLPTYPDMVEIPAGR